MALARIGEFARSKTRKPTSPTNAYKHTGRKPLESGRRSASGLEEPLGVERDHWKYTDNTALKSSSPEMTRNLCHTGSLQTSDSSKQLIPTS